MRIAGAAEQRALVDDVPLGGDAVTDLHALDKAADRNHIAGELMAANERRLATTGGPCVPLVNVHVGAADAGAAHANEHLVVADRGLRHLGQSQATSSRLLHQRFHVAPRRTGVRGVDRVQPERSSCGWTAKSRTRTERVEGRTFRCSPHLSTTSQ